jgi:hypothetical protein
VDEAQPAQITNERRLRFSDAAPGFCLGLNIASTI